MVLYVQNVQNILRKCLLYTEVTDRLPWRSTCLRNAHLLLCESIYGSRIYIFLLGMWSSNLKITTTGKMAQHAIFFPRLQINSKILYYRPLVTCRPLPGFTHS